ncbi:MAG TPA: DNA translocase FtsK [bacterium]|nr:DNA translocase FtsK [bacterium]
MPSIRPHEVLSEAWNEIEEPRRKEISSLILFATAIILALALLTADPADVAGAAGSQDSGAAIRNWIGKPGAYLAYACFALFGWCGMALPIAIGYIAVCRFRGIRRWQIGWAEYAGIVLLLASSCSFLAAFRLLSDCADSVESAWHSGGALGFFLAHRVLALGEVGGMIVNVAVWVVGFLLATPFLISDLLRGSYRTGADLYDRWRRPVDEEDIEHDLEPLEPFDVEPSIRTKNSFDSTLLPPLKTIEELESESNFQEFNEEPSPAPRNGASKKKRRGVEELEPLIVTNDTRHSQERDRSVNYVETPNNENYQLPPLALLKKSAGGQPDLARDEILHNSRVLESTLNDFGISARVVEVNYGPTITCYELEPAPGIKISRIENLANDITRALKACTVRIVAPIPGKGTVGVEVPNKHRSDVFLRDVLGSDVYQRHPSKLKIALGKTITGEPFSFDLRQAPHLLVAGATGSGKSVCVNSIISSILYNAAPHEVKLLLIDPKQVELALYRDIPHLLSPVVTDPKRAGAALRWAVEEMENRYRYLKHAGVRNIGEYNERRKQDYANEEIVVLPSFLPYIVILIDELADLMMIARAEVESMIARLAAMARAVGIHLVLATQRPSVDVLTGVIKNNFPARIAFQVSSTTDSRTILDMKGAESLMGRGDMLFTPGGAGRPERLQGCFVSSEEVACLVDFVKDQQEVQYIQDEFVPIEDDRESEYGEFSDDDDYDELFDEAVRIVLENDSASTSLLQRRMKIGYGRAARLLDLMEDKQIVGPPRGSKPREIILHKTP